MFTSFNYRWWETTVVLIFLETFSQSESTPQKGWKATSVDKKRKGKLIRNSLNKAKQGNFIKIALRHGHSPVNLLHTFRILFTKNTSLWVAASVIFRMKYLFINLLKSRSSDILPNVKQSLNLLQKKVSKLARYKANGNLKSKFD